MTVAKEEKGDEQKIDIPSRLSPYFIRLNQSCF